MLLLQGVSSVKVQSTKPQDTAQLQSSHEEADTRLILYAISCKTDTVVIFTRDTDVLILLLAYVDKLKSSCAWMMSGTLQKKKFIPVKTVAATLSPEQIESF